MHQLLKIRTTQTTLTTHTARMHAHAASSAGSRAFVRDMAVIAEQLAMHDMREGYWEHAARGLSPDPNHGCVVSAHRPCNGWR